MQSISTLNPSQWRQTLGGVSDQRPGGSGAPQCSREFDVHPPNVAPVNHHRHHHADRALDRSPPSTDPSVRIVKPSSSRCVPPQCLRYAIDLVSSCLSSTLQLQSLRPGRWHWQPNRTRCHRFEPSSKATIRRHFRGLLYHRTRLIACSRHPVRGCAADNTAHDAAWEHWLLKQRLGPVAPAVVLICQQTRRRRAPAFDSSAAWRLYAASSARQRRHRDPQVHLQD